MATMSMCSFLALAVAGYLTPVSGDVAAVKQFLGKAITHFGMDMNKVLSLSTGNVMFSPVGIHLILSMLLLGAKGRTAKELRTALEVNSVRDYEVLYREWLSVKDSCNDTTYCHFILSNSMWIDEGLILHDKYQKELMECYGPYMGVINTDPNGTTPSALVKQWLSSSPGGLPEVPLMLPERNPFPSSLFLINAVDFHHSWKNEFIPKSLYDMEFRTLSYRNSKVKAMIVKGQFGHAFSAALGGHVVRMPLKNTRFGFYLLVPAATDGLVQLENTLARRGVDIDAVLQSVGMKEAEIHLPKFSAVHSIRMVPSLFRMGVRDVFSRFSDFSLMTDDQLSIRYIKQLARISLDVKNVSVRSVNLLSRRATPAVVVKANRPFLYFIRDDDYNIPILQGRFVEPSMSSFVEY